MANLNARDEGDEGEAYPCEMPPEIEAVSDREALALAQDEDLKSFLLMPMGAPDEDFVPIWIRLTDKLNRVGQKIGRELHGKLQPQNAISFSTVFFEKLITKAMDFGITAENAVTGKVAILEQLIVHGFFKTGVSEGLQAIDTANSIVADYLLGLDVQGLGL